MPRPTHVAPGTPGPRPEEEAAHPDVLAQVLRLLAILRRRWLVVGVAAGEAIGWIVLLALTLR